MPMAAPARPSSPSKASRTPSRFCKPQTSAFKTDNAGSLLAHPPCGDGPKVTPRCFWQTELPDFEASLANSRFDLGDHVIRTEVEHRSCQHSIGSGFHGWREMRRLTGTTGGDDRDVDRTTDKADQFEVESVLGAVSVDRVQKDLSHTPVRGFLGPGDGVAS